jgi:hypothetical protein
MLITVQWCKILSRIAEAIVTSEKMSFHCKKDLFEVKMVDVFSWRMAMSWKNRLVGYPGNIQSHSDNELSSNTIFAD